LFVIRQRLPLFVIPYPESLVPYAVELLGRRGPQWVPSAGSDAAFRMRFYH
jgi:hypothetical protein